MNQPTRHTVTITAIIPTETTKQEWARTTAAPDAPYAHTPAITVTVDKESKLYEQTVSELDVRAVIAAVNGGEQEQVRVEIDPRAFGSVLGTSIHRNAT